MTTREHSKFVMAAQQREQDLLKDPQANEKDEIKEIEIHRSDHPSSHASAPLGTMAPPGIDMGSESGSLELSDSPDKAGDRKRRSTATSLEHQRSLQPLRQRFTQATG
jgi:hypothetical protein